MTARLKWYSATLTFASRVGGIRSLRPLCEERVVLIRAPTESRARVLAAQYGHAEAHSYANARGEQVEWLFAKIDRPEQLEPLPAQGCWEVASRFQPTAPT
ncbi:MAG: DUF4288 domain-containing protein [Gemmatimonadetes bacterium]|nr:DUF4288 domain-containing protein [Gemmatimonadota bacterium]